MEDNVINWRKKRLLRIRWLGVAAILISLLFINFPMDTKTEDDSANLPKEELLLSEDGACLLTEEENLLLTELEKIQADLKIHP